MKSLQRIKQIGDLAKAFAKQTGRGSNPER
jgi:hypothetical protein